MRGIFNPYYGSPLIIPFGYRRWNRCRNRSKVKRLDQNGIYVLNTNSVQLRLTGSVDYGINPDIYKQLPCECIVLLRINEAIPEGGEALPVLLAVPQTSETETSAYGVGHIFNYSTLKILDGQDNPVKGLDVYNNTEVLTYLDKRNGVMKFLGFTPTAEA